MDQTTGGRWLDTGDGPMPFTGLMLGNALEGAAQTAYRAYLDHRKACELCPQSTDACDAAVSLWETYMAMRESA
jgi:hypothetical protein